MARIAHRFHGPALVSNVAATKLTVAANEKGIIRHIHLSNPSASPVSFTMSIGTDATAVRIFDGFSVAASTIHDHFGLYTLEETEVIQAFAGTNNILVLTINGERSVLS